MTFILKDQIVKAFHKLIKTQKLHYLKNHQRLENLPEKF